MTTPHEIPLNAVQNAIREDSSPKASRVSAEAVLLGALLAKKLRRLQRPHVHTYWTKSLPWLCRDFFEDEPEDLGRDKDGDQKYRHVLRDNCSITKIASRHTDYETEIVYLLAGPVGEKGEQREEFLVLSHCPGVETESARLEKSDVPAWAWIQFDERISK